MRSSGQRNRTVKSANRVTRFINLDAPAALIRRELALLTKHVDTLLAAEELSAWSVHPPGNPREYRVTLVEEEV
jgi:DNA-directed RNA polymerase beta' subunit